MNVVLLGIVGDANSLYADPMPAIGHLTLSLPLVAPPAAPTAPQFLSRRSTRRVVPIRPLRPIR
jgi:hypothetical protein